MENGDIFRNRSFKTNRGALPYRLILRMTTPDKKLYLAVNKTSKRNLCLQRLTG